MLEITDLKYASSNMPVIKVIGVGGCGNNAVNRLSQETRFPFQFIVLHSAAAPSCGASLAAASRRCHLAGLQACAASPCAARCGAAGLQPAS